MKSWFVLLTALLVCGIFSNISADEILIDSMEQSFFENPFENIEIAHKADMWSSNSYVYATNIHFTSLQALSADIVGDTAESTIGSSGRISTPHNYLELTPMWGYTFDGEFEDWKTGEILKIADGSSMGFRIAYDYGYNSQIEFLYSHQETELTGGDLFPRDALFSLDVDYYHIGGSLFWDRGSELEPYFTGTLGLTHFNPQDSGVNSLARFSMGLGGGVRYFPVRRFGLYTGARGMVTFVNSDFYVYSGESGTYVKIIADDVWQFQVYAGLIFVF